MALLDAKVVEAGGEFFGDEVDVGVGEYVVGFAVDEAGTVFEFGEILEAVSI